MTPATLVAGIAAGLAAVGAAEAVAVLRRRERRPRRCGRAVALLARLGRSLGVTAPRTLGDRVTAAGLGVQALSLIHI